MINLKLSAHRNVKFDPPILYIHGSISVYTKDSLVDIRKVYPQGSNINILLLKLSVKESNGPRKGTSKNFTFEIEGDEIFGLESVQVELDDGSTVTSKIIDSSHVNLVGMKLRTYKEGDVITDDSIENRVNLVTDLKGKILNIWFG